jgi:hypothetical protein
VKNIERTEINGTTVTTIWNGIDYQTQIIGGTHDGDTLIAKTIELAHTNHAYYTRRAH